MAALHGHFGLVGPRTAEFPGGTPHEGARFGIDEEFRHLRAGRHIRAGQPIRVRLGDRHHVFRLPVDGNLARPSHRRTPGFTGLEVGAAVHSHFLIGEPAQNRTRQHPFHEDVVLQRHGLPRWRAEALKDARRVRRKLRPGDGPNDGLHVANALDGAAMPVGPVKAERRAPVVDHEHHVLFDPERFEQGIEITGVLGEGVAVRSRVVQLVGVAHADQVRRQAMPEAGHRRHDVAPQVGRGGIAVQEHDRIALTHFGVGHLLAKHFDFLLGQFVCVHLCRSLEIVDLKRP